MADENADLDAMLAEALLDPDDQQDEVAVASAVSTNVPAVDGNADRRRGGGRVRVNRTEWSPLPAELNGYPFTTDVDGEFVICQAFFVIQFRVNHLVINHILRREPRADFLTFVIM